MTTIHLEIVSEGRTIDRHTFENPREIIIGRHEDCDVRVDNKGFSRQHAAITKVGNGFVLEDLGSSNGTYVRGEKVRKRGLTSGEVFSIVGVKFAFEIEGASLDADDANADAEGSTFDLTLRVVPKATRKLNRTLGAQISRLNAHVVVDEDEGTFTLLLLQSAFKIGRDPRSDLPIPSRRAPRLAALLLRDLEEYWLLDVSPKGNCVRVEGEPARVHSLSDGEFIEVCGTKLRFYLGMPRLEEAFEKNSRLPTARWRADGDGSTG